MLVVKLLHRRLEVMGRSPGAGIPRGSRQDVFFISRKILRNRDAAAK
jgi:hypothetical protein